MGVNTGADAEIMSKNIGGFMRKISLEKIYSIIIIAAIFFTMGVIPAVAGENNKTASASEGNDSTKFIAYYFYNSNRCSSCYRIENWAETAIKENFQQEVQSGKLEWKPVNIDKEKNKHFIQDFNLYTKSLIIVEKNDGKTERWENLKKVWNLLRDKDRYFDYVSSNIRKFMENS